MPSPSCAHPHFVLFYRDEASAQNSISGYLATALRAGEPALVIAKPKLLLQVRTELHRQHVQGVPFGPGRGQLVELDAADTLKKICVDGKPDAHAFERVVGGALAALTTATDQRVAAYGEMVGLLCERGQYADAVHLENLWNALLAKARASLFCGYPRRLFQSAATKGFMDQIRAAHTHTYDEALAA
ncbi:MAG: histidine kinase [Ramlibacter sp.]|nr:histidine kinase [Ramlibacter sp.]